ncbi:hypothetical protein GGR54DRAFT_601630, partial [Hypoxylon sp. NC1633]
MNMSGKPAEMGMGEKGAMSDSQMVMTFFFSSTTSLFSKTWTPATSAQYAGTCTFLIVLAVVMRAMLALKPILEKSVWNPMVNREGVLIPDDDAGYNKGEIAPQRVTGRVYSAVRRRWSFWRLGTSLGRAVFELLLASVGYLL